MSENNIKSSLKTIPAGDFGIAHEGYPLLFFLSLTSLSFALLDWEFFTLLSLLILFFTLHFFRDPERVVPQDISCAVSPADGKIIRIQEDEDPITKEERLCISVFMNVFSVHVNRVPMHGIIKKIVYFPGAYFNAAWDKASTENERCAYQLEDNNNDNWTFVQISGLIARRIVCKVKEGDELEKGGRFGMIRFGSRVDIYIPKSYVPAVNIGEQVYAGQSVLARKKEA